MNKRREHLKGAITIAVVGAGPAGSSASIRLAGLGHRVVLIDKDRFPRHKLCGEFISPECFPHFGKLGVADLVDGAGGSRISETRFYALNGKIGSIPSGWFHGETAALSLSRAAMDLRLIQRAREVGVEVFEGTRVTGVDVSGKHIDALRIRRPDGTNSMMKADIVVDASGRSAIVKKMLERQSGLAPVLLNKPEYIAFKSHFQAPNASLDKCEIYSFQGGYGGFSPIEAGRHNLCFLVRRDAALRSGNDPDRIMLEQLFSNERAKGALSDSRQLEKWLSVAITGFGRPFRLNIENLISIGDAAAFIDPFTGSGMLMALESSDLLSELFERETVETKLLAETYDSEHRARFRGRLTICRMLRHLAFEPRVAGVLISLIGRSRSASRMLALATRPSHVVWHR